MKMGPKFVRIQDVEGTRKEPPRVSRTLLCEKNVGLKNVSMGVNITEVDSMIPYHIHETEEEAMFLISGKAKVFVGDEEEGYDIEPDTAFCVDKGVKHKIVNTGDEPFKLLWVYSPPLPGHKKE